MKKITNVKELATEIVGDGKKPNKYFVTFGYGWYFPFGDDADMIQADNSMDSVTVLFTTKQAALNAMDSIEFTTDKAITGETIGQVILEDRLTGTIREKYLRQRNNGTFFVDTY